MWRTIRARGRAMRARVIDRDLGPLAGQQVGDVDLAAIRHADAAAGVVERNRGDLAPVALHRLWRALPHDGGRRRAHHRRRLVGRRRQRRRGRAARRGWSSRGRHDDAAVRRAARRRRAGVAAGRAMSTTRARCAPISASRSTSSISRPSSAPRWSKISSRRISPGETPEIRACAATSTSSSRRCSSARARSAPTRWSPATTRSCAREPTARSGCIAASMRRRINRTFCSRCRAMSSTPSDSRSAA